MITIKYSREMNEIVGFINTQCYSLKTLEPIDTPKDLIDVIPFIKNMVSSCWIELPYREEEEYFYHFLKEVYDIFPRKIRISNILLDLDYTHNEVGERFYRISGHLPKYVLSGIGELASRKYYTVKEEEDLYGYLTKFVNGIFENGIHKYTMEDIFSYQKESGLIPKPSQEVSTNFKGICIKYKKLVRYIPEEYIQEAKKELEKLHYIKVEVIEY